MGVIAGNLVISNPSQTTLHHLSELRPGTPLTVKLLVLLVAYFSSMLAEMREVLVVSVSTRRREKARGHLLSMDARGSWRFGADKEKRKKCMGFAHSSRMREVLVDLLLTIKSKSLMCGRRCTGPTKTICGLSEMEPPWRQADNRLPATPLLRAGPWRRQCWHLVAGVALELLKRCPLVSSLLNIGGGI